MTPVSFLDGRITLHAGDSRDVLRGFPDDHFDSVATDPPYALTAGKKGGSGDASINLNSPAGRARIATGNGERGFMGKAWDNGETAFSVDFWRDVLRVLKPGGHVVAFGGTRTEHRLTCAIEDAGFEIREKLLWLFGTGFPKSLDVGKAIDKAAGAAREPTGEIRRASIQRNGAGENWAAGAFGSHPEDTKRVIATAPATEAARAWEGWGTALKPACEIITLARKPLDTSPERILLTPEVLATWEARRCAHA